MNDIFSAGFWKLSRESILIACLFIAIIFLTFFLKKLCKMLSKLLQKQFINDFLGLKAIENFYLPLNIIIVICSISYSIKLFFETNYVINQLIDTAQSVVVFFCFCWMLSKWKKELHKGLINKSQSGIKELTMFKIDIMMKIFSLILFTIIALYVIKFFGIDIQGLLTVGGIGALAIGLAAKDILANFFSGAIMYLTHPFSVGETICIDDGKIIGKIEEIGWYLVKIIDFDKNPIYIPNSLFSSKIIKNRSRISHWRFKENIGIRYKDFKVMESLLIDIRNYIASSPYIDKNERHFVRFITFASSSLEICVSAYTITKEFIEFLEIKERLLVDIGDIIDKNNAQVAFSTHTIEINQNIL